MTPTKKTIQDFFVISCLFLIVAINPMRPKTKKRIFEITSKKLGIPQIGLLSIKL
jgi:hypothetical protein